MKQEKCRPQVICATRNVNVPVLGHAGLIIGMSPRGEFGDGQAARSANHMGALDHLGVRKLVEEVLESGRRAFELRWEKYGL